MNAIRSSAQRGVDLAKTITIKHNIEGIANMNDSLALIDHLKKFGTLVTFNFRKDPLTKERTGLAFASYLHYDDVNNAIKKRSQIVDKLKAPYNSIEIEPFNQKSRPQTNQIKLI
ncbi:hypothetical protein GGH94_005257 [Coemansia aciculifera]|uniref:RRM domain-containing protein n=1 Tax=Coemansia aciculifera TaxID=417176 RepID=A0A9W8M1H1_9FUNG|nr:hypothetical protein GGH94_005257 [Coemansia aciculifera]KAJ2871001.1 hypothetical protein GGH93_005163 [Coemansia aciculifera]